MVAPQVLQPFVGGLAGPQVKRHRPTPEIIVHSPHHLQLGLLHHVQGIQPPPQGRIQMEVNERLQLRLIAGQQLVQSVAVAAVEPVQKAPRLLGIGFHVGHGFPSTYLPPVGRGM